MKARTGEREGVGAGARGVPVALEDHGRLDGGAHLRGAVAVELLALEHVEAARRQGGESEPVPGPAGSTAGTKNALRWVASREAGFLPAVRAHSSKKHDSAQPPARFGVSVQHHVIGWL